MRPVAVIALALILVACGSDKKSAEPTGPSASTPTTADCPPLPGAALTSRVSPAVEQRETMFLTDVSVEALDCADRVTFEFKESAPGPGFEVAYKPERVAKIEDGSGKPLAVAGAAFLVVRLTPAMTAEISGEDVTPTYTGPREIAPSTDARFLRDVVKTGDFESVVTWAIGVDRKRPFRTTASSSQLVVEIGS
jgi:hypothetical protein